MILKRRVLRLPMSYAVSPNPLHSIDMRRSMVVILVTVYFLNQNTEMCYITYPVVTLCYYRREVVMGSESQVPTQPGRFHKKVLPRFKNRITRFYTICAARTHCIFILNCYHQN